MLQRRESNRLSRAAALIGRCESTQPAHVCRADHELFAFGKTV